MIEITVSKSHDGHYKEFISSGHADYARRGKDIVCSAVSVLVVNTVNSLENFTKDSVRVSSDEREGLIRIEFLSQNSKEAELLMDSLLLGLQGIKENKNEKYIHIVYKEV